MSITSNKIHAQLTIMYVNSFLSFFLLGIIYENYLLGRKRAIWYVFCMLLFSTVLLHSVFNHVICLNPPLAVCWLCVNDCYFVFFY